MLSSFPHYAGEIKKFSLSSAVRPTVHTLNPSRKRNFSKTLSNVQTAVMGLITVFGAFLTGRQSGQKWQCLYGNLMKTLSRRLSSPSLKDVARLERAQLIFLIFHTFVCKFGRVEGAHGKKNYRKMYGEVGKINWAPSIQPTFFKLWCSLQGLQMSKAP